MIAATEQSPYKGLVPFEDTEVDALRFFGRERESEILAANVLAARLTVLFGASGVGKTSLLRAGVAYRLRRQAMASLEERGHPELAVVVFGDWSDDPVVGLRDAVRDELASLFGSALLDVRPDESLTDTLERWTDVLACDVLLLLDQAEEYFLYHSEQAGFAEELPELVTRPGLRVRVLLSIRDDALAKLDRFKARIPNLFANYVRLDHLDRRAARDAIVNPVERYSEATGRRVEIEPELIVAVLDQTAAGKVDLGDSGRGLGAGEEQEGRIEAPYLQLVLERIWDEEAESSSDVLRAETLAKLGGAEAIVRTHLRRAVEELSDEQRNVAADVFRYLVTPSGTKIAHGVDDLAEYASVDEQLLAPVLATLGRERIVRTVDGDGGGARYEIFHDVLAEAVLAWRREQEVERERRRAERRHRRLAAVAITSLLGLVAMTLVAIYAFAQRSEAQDAEEKARARELVATASANLVTDPDRSLALALETAKLDATPAAEDVLRTSLINSRVQRIIRVGNVATAASYSPNGRSAVATGEGGDVVVFDPATGSVRARARHPGGVTTAAFSLDSRLIATGGPDRTVRLWTSDGEERAALRHAAAVQHLAFGPDSLITAADGRLTAWNTADESEAWRAESPGATGFALSDDGLLATYGTTTVTIHDARTGELVTRLPHQGRVTSAAFAPSGRLLVTGAADHTAKVWDLRGAPRVVHDLRGHTGHVTDVEVSPRGDLVLTTNTDGTSRLWDLATGDVAHILMGHANFVVSGTFSPGGLFVVTTSTDGTGRVWGTETGNLITALVGHGASVGGAAYSPGGRSILTFGADGTARVWDPDAEPLLGVIGRLPAPARGAEAAILSPDASLIAATGGGALRMLDDAGRLLYTEPRVGEAEFSPDSRRVVGADLRGNVSTWTARDHARLDSYGLGVGPEQVAFAPDERIAAVGDGTLLIPRTTGRHLPGTDRFPIAARAPTALAWSPEGGRLVVGTGDGMIYVLDEQGREIARAHEHRDDITAVRFSPDGRRFVTSSADHDVRVWDAEAGRHLHLLRAHYAVVSDARFSDDGRWIVTAGPGKAGLWNAETGRRLFFLRGHDGILRSAAFRPETHEVVTVGEDGTVREYDCALCGGADELIELAEQRLAGISSR